MAKFDLKFIDLVNDNDYIKTGFLKKESHQFYNEDAIEIYGLEGGTKFTIILDKSTAIKFAKTLRTEINKITAREEGKDV